MKNLTFRIWATIATLLILLFLAHSCSDTESETTQYETSA